MKRGATGQTPEKRISLLSFFAFLGGLLFFLGR